ncbi:MAG: hypothetical protein M3R27_15445, partial [Bacteroidota bacterium]|nr:hypothetical protein [Bacteroidota bacterium]
MKKCYSFLSALIISGFLLFLSSCEIYNPAEQIPAYIRVEKFILTTDNFSQGSNSHKITDVWVYVDEILVGCFELPVTIPVLYEGSHQVKLRAGIKVNGISASRAPYPFYTIHEQTVDFQPTKKITLTPT